tara:strand:+ start:116 stop:943 length:828 start_codon:yes stop_codon:yes gene_type:complete
MLIKKLKPKIIIGTGGYSSGLPLLAAIHLGIPTLIQDQNSIPGLITNKLQNKITTICTAYKNFPLKNSMNNIVMTGNPIRSNLIPINRNNAIEKLQLEVNKKTILILGGSQGSQPINTHIINNINFFLDNNYQIIWQCGEKNYNYIPNSIINHKSILVNKFFDNMSLIYSAADLTISRAGALAISELLFMEKAFILIPFQYAANQHQDINATYIEKENACIKIKEGELKSGILEKRIYEILESTEKLEELKINASRIKKPNATKEIIEEIEKIIS